MNSNIADQGSSTEQTLQPTRARAGGANTLENLPQEILVSIWIRVDEPTSLSITSVSMVGLSSSVLHPNLFSDSRADPLCLFHLPLLDFSPCSIRKRSLPQDFILLL